MNSGWSMVACSCESLGSGLSCSSVSLLFAKIDDGTSEMGKLEEGASLEALGLEEHLLRDTVDPAMPLIVRPQAVLPKPVSSAAQPPHPLFPQRKSHKDISSPQLTQPTNPCLA